jgi:hypothetical protein
MSTGRASRASVLTSASFFLEDVAQAHGIPQISARVAQREQTDL